MPKKKHTSHRTLSMVGPQAPFQFVEAYKSLRTNLEFLSAAADCKVIVVTSSVPEEGKSNVAVNLALTLASSNKRVVLLDGDLRKGTLTRYLRISKKHSGISNMLTGTAEWKNVLTPIESQNLILVPTGPLPPNPTELISTPRMADLMKDLRDYADYVIVDTPPISVITDAAIFSRIADGVILVVRPGVTTIQGAQLSKKNLEAVGARILGAVMNGYDVKKSSRKDGYYYSYSYDYYSSGDEAPRADKTAAKA